MPPKPPPGHRYAPREATDRIVPMNAFREIEQIRMERDGLRRAIETVLAEAGTRFPTPVTAIMDILEAALEGDYPS